MLNIFENTKIYIACPPNSATGGPEALQTLTYELIKKGYNAIIWFYNESNNPVEESFKYFNNPWTYEIEDSKENILIVPEVRGDILKKFNNIQKVFWWLSVDNYFNSIVSSKKYNGVKSLIRKIFKKYNNKQVNFNDKTVLHLAQSYYAMQFLKSKNLKNTAYLSDYTSHKITNSRSYEYKNREDIVLYNPKKGYEFTQKLIKKAKNITFIPIENMNKEQIISLMAKSKVYIDFGNHPGKDRIPREAAILGNIVITNKRGSTKYQQDVCIFDKYKISDIEININRIIKMIQYCLNNYEVCINDFEQYRQKILKEEEVFLNEIDNIFNNKNKVT